MLLAKLALGVGGTLAVAGAYTFHDGVLRVEERHTNGKPVHVWVPAAIVPMAVHMVPRAKLEEAVEKAGPFMPALRALSRELKKYPDAELVDVRDNGDHVRVLVRDGKLLVDVDNPDEHVHVACPLAVLEDISYQLEARAPKT
jgi:hypothetical protein